MTRRFISAASGLGAVFCLSLALMSCNSGSSGNGQGADAGLYTGYDLTYNGCHTGPQRFDVDNIDERKRQYCEALKDDGLNNSCAEPLRLLKFEKYCDGYRWSDDNSHHDDDGHRHDGHHDDGR